MNIRTRLASVTTAAGLLAASAAGAHADIIYNDLDGSVDAAAELMRLTYNSATATPGPAGSTTLAIEVQDQAAGDHPGCNIQGGNHYIVLDHTIVVTSGTDPVTVSVPDNRFDACNETLTVIVTPQDLGSARISFGIVASSTSNDRNLTFSTAEATFDVTVQEAEAVGGTVCDADPAAPAWAAAILKGSSVKFKPAESANLVSRVAHRMGADSTDPTSFGGYTKNTHPQYEEAVRQYLADVTGTQLAQTSAVARPGWVCTPAT